MTRRLSFMGTLPSGEQSLSATMYVRKWRSLGERLERFMGGQLSAFDPDLIFRQYPYGTVVVSAPLALKIAAALDLIDQLERKGE